MDTTLSGLSGTGRGSEEPTTAVAVDFLSRPDGSFNMAGSAKEQGNRTYWQGNSISIGEGSLKGHVLQTCCVGTMHFMPWACTFRHLHDAGPVLFVLFWVRGSGVRQRPTLPLHGDGDVTALQVPTWNVTAHYRCLVFYWKRKHNNSSTFPCCLSHFWLLSDFTSFISVPDHAVHAADLLVGVAGLIVEGQLLLQWGPALLHSEPGFSTAERRGWVFGPNHCWVLLYGLFRREAGVRDRVVIGAVFLL